MIRWFRSCWSRRILRWIDDMDERGELRTVRNWRPNSGNFTGFYERLQARVRREES